MMWLNLASYFFGGFFNAIVAYLLVVRVSAFDPRTTAHSLAFGSGALVIGLFLARQFGRFHGGNAPART